MGTEGGTKLEVKESDKGLFAPGTGQLKRGYGEVVDGLGRFPANLIHDNSDEVRECFPNESERFFKSIIYQAKASKSERNKGCEELPQKEKRYIASLS